MSYGGVMFNAARVFDCAASQAYHTSFDMSPVVYGAAMQAAQSKMSLLRQMADAQVTAPPLLQTVTLDTRPVGPKPAPVAEGDGIAINPLSAPSAQWEALAARPAVQL